MNYLLPMVHTVQVYISGNALRNSYTAITNLNQYEDRAETAAKYLSTAEKELHKTRTTQTSGALAVSYHPPQFKPFP